jgi:hypothetical protein
MIFICRERACWMASFGHGICHADGYPMPCAELPLPFGADANVDVVIADLQRRFPCADVRLSHADMFVSAMAALADSAAPSHAQADNVPDYETYASPPVFDWNVLGYRN